MENEKKKNKKKTQTLARDGWWRDMSVGGGNKSATAVKEERKETAGTYCFIIMTYWYLGIINFWHLSLFLASVFIYLFFSPLTVNN